ncbi:MAG: alanine racemase [Acidobacteriota bacterium]
MGKNNSSEYKDNSPDRQPDLSTEMAERVPATRRQTWAEIDLAALKANYLNLRSLLPDPLDSAQSTSYRRRIIPVIKTDAYGHGAAEAARTLAEAGVEMFAVGNVEEGIALRQEGIHQDLLVLATTWQGQESVALDHRLTLAVDSIRGLESLRASAGIKDLPAPVHIKVDTGMGRLGIRWDSLQAFLNVIRQSEHIQMEGVFTHLSSADDYDPSYTLNQCERFESVLNEIRKAGLNPGEIHCANSAGLLYHPSLRRWGCRVGIALYGYAPVEGKTPIQLQPVLSLKTRVGPLRNAHPGESIGYSRKFTASRETRYATLPIGYADGLPRRLSNNIQVIVRGGWAEVIGTVSMDMVTVDLTDRPDVCEGDEVILLGSSGDCSTNADTWAGNLGTISYEILCGIATRVPRVYVNRPAGENSQ